jgi:tetratricopeptide (TPR) repeat protein
VVCLLTVFGTTEAWSQDINTLFDQFTVQIDAGHPREAESIARQMIAVAPTDGWKAGSYNALGRTYANQKHYKEAAEAYEQALAFPLSPTATNGGWIPNNLGIVYRKLKQYDKAESYYLRALAFFKGLKGQNSDEVATVYANLGNLCRETKRYDESENYQRQALTIRQAIYGPEHRDVASSLSNLGDLERSRGRYDQAVAYHKQALAMRQKLQSPEHPAVAGSLRGLSDVCRDQHNFAEAEALDRQCLAITEQAVGINQLGVVEDLENLATDLEGLKRPAEAKPLRDRVKAIETGKSSDAAPVNLSVIVRTEGAKIEADGQPVATASKGQRLEVYGIDGPWCAVAIKTGEKLVTGWIADQNVLSAINPSAGTTAVPPAPSKPLWTSLKPSAAGASIDFPGSPGATTMTVNNVTMYAYTLNTTTTTYAFSYFDVPQGSVLTFDAAINAYATQGRGTVESQTNVIIDENAGREVLVRMPDNSVSRLQLLHVNQRWYEICVKGTAEVIQGEEAKRFVESFKLAQ